MKRISVSIFAILLCLTLSPSSVKADFSGVSGLDTNIPEATAGSEYITKIYFGCICVSDPTLDFTGLPPGITMGSLIDPDGPAAIYSFYLEGTPNDSGNFKPVLTIRGNGGVESTYEFDLTVNGPKYPLITNTPTGINLVQLVNKKLPDATAGVTYKTQIGFSYVGETAHYGGNAVPIFTLDGLPPGVTAGSLMDEGTVPSIQLTTWYSIPLIGLFQNPGNYNPVLTISESGTDSKGASYVFKFDLVVKTASSTVTNTPKSTSQSEQKQTAITTNPSSTQATTTPIQPTQNQPAIKTSKIKRFLFEIGNFFKSIGRWFKK
jgi:hypothetical protein